ncbi:type II secretion system protein [Shewanella sp. YIC-542]|uniref:type II secretion system protein n=1 Tax=Shewanella mytili TaxID=3377111 RepID=UPI00398E6137
MPKCFNFKIINSQSLKSLHGFTLIELVMVIMLLAILAVTVLPHFINLKGDAKQAVIKNVASGIHELDQQVYLKSVILGIQDNDRNLNATDTNPQGGFLLNGQFIQTIYGHPWLFDGDRLSNLLQADIQYETLSNRDKVCDYSGDFCAMEFHNATAPTDVGVNFQPGNAMLIYLPGDSIANNCYAYYIFDRTNNDSMIGSVMTGCN